MASSVEAGLLLNFRIRAAQSRARPHRIECDSQNVHFDARHQRQIDVGPVSL